MRIKFIIIFLKNTMQFILLKKKTLEIIKVYFLNIKFDRIFYKLSLANITICLLKLISVSKKAFWRYLIIVFLL